MTPTRCTWYYIRKQEMVTCVCKATKHGRANNCSTAAIDVRRGIPGHTVTRTSINSTQRTVRDPTATVGPIAVHSPAGGANSPRRRSSSPALFASVALTRTDWFQGSPWRYGQGRAPHIPGLMGDGDPASAGVATARRRSSVGIG
jgi:hypothetical protein